MSIKIAHVRKSDGAIQTVEAHLLEVSEITQQLAKKFNLPDCGALIGLLHDYGKLSSAFQSYIKACVAKTLPDYKINFDIDDDSVDCKALKGKIDHSTAGAQWIHQQLPKSGFGELCAQILNLCVVSHHGGLIDCLDPDGNDNFNKRITKADEKTHFGECCSWQEDKVLARANELVNSKLIDEMSSLVKAIFVTKPQSGTPEISSKVKEFYLGCLTRCLFSCLVDADRISSADFEAQQNVSVRSKTAVDWQVAVDRFESFIDTLGQEKPIDKIRSNISKQCQQRADDVQGIYSLTVPTGGGKTFASLRYALHHSRKHKLDRIIYIIPYTSIIEQNAQEIRKILEVDGDAYSSWVLEHHSNLESEQQTWQSKLLTENWDAPVIFTTMVQFLDAWFGSGTRSVRRLHQMANSVLIFDEIQTLPIKCVHMFCNALNFLVSFGKTTAILCTATQPVLNELRDENKGQLLLGKNHELIGNSNEVNQLFDLLERVEIVNLCKEPGWSREELTDFAMQTFAQTGSCLIVVNTKAWANNLYLSFINSGIKPEELYYLSTNQCPAHRKIILETIKTRLKEGKPVLCVSTQLIEAGVDISFNSAIRFLAGFDSIAQAAGRCNRHGLLQDESEVFCKGKVYVVNPYKETITRLDDIVEGQKAARRVFSEESNASMLSPASIKQYFNYYFFERAEKMVYPYKDQLGSTDSLLNLLSDNQSNTFAGKNSVRQQSRLKPLLMQSFATANKLFAAIDAPTKAVITPYGPEGGAVIANLCAEFDPKNFKETLREAQKFSVNVFPNTWKKLKEAAAVFEVLQSGIYYLDKQYYDKNFGLATEKVAEADFLMV